MLILLQIKLLIRACMVGCADSELICDAKHACGAGAAGAALARRLAQAWLANARAGWQHTGAMAEKHNATCPGQAGGGGEYAVQASPHPHVAELQTWGSLTICYACGESMHALCCLLIIYTKHDNAKGACANGPKALCGQ